MNSKSRITRWLVAYKRFKPRQLFNEMEANKNGVYNWKKRKSKPFLTNIKWVQNEHERMKNKGIRTKIITRNFANDVEVALFKEE